ncbi:MAG TPA: DUF92 domain-containing protein [Limnochordales bacterium]
MAPVASWATAVTLALGVAVTGWRAGALTPSGAVAAALVGALVFGAGGLPWAVLLVGFFVSGSGLTVWRRRVRGDGRPGGRAGGRDARQVLANGGVAAVAAVLRLVAETHPVQLAAGSGMPTAWAYHALVAGSLAAMTADTWATEVGVASGRIPVSIIGGRPVEPGRSGGVTAPGTAAGTAGAALMAALVWGMLRSPTLAWGALVGGVSGMLLDSLMGAAWQGRWRCQSCGRAVERPRRHRQSCAGPLRLEGGRPWLDNDGVNALASAAGGLVAVAATALAGVT